MNSLIDVTCFSDSHLWHDKLSLPGGDVLIFSGDFMSSGYTEREVVDFLDWFDSLNYEVKIMIAGNHDRYCENHRFHFKDHLKYRPTITYLENEGITVGGVNVWGTPDTKIFYNWAFNRDSNALRRSFAKIPEDTHILVSHGPACGILDQVVDGEHLGEQELTDRIGDLAQLRYHIHGHIHDSYGVKDCGRYTAFNCSVVNEQYRLQNKPIQFVIFTNDIKDEKITIEEGIREKNERERADERRARQDDEMVSTDLG